MTITEDEWRELETPHDTPGRSNLRLHLNAPLDIFLSVAHPDSKRMLVFRVDARSADLIVRSVRHLPQAAGIEMSLTAVSRMEYELQITLADKDLSEVFNPLISDVADTASIALSAPKALEAAVERFGRWQELLRAVSTDGLGSEARRGLFGELLILESVLLTTLAQVEAVEAWTGPTGSNQDFQLPTVAIETKASTSKHPRSIRIASERQLDETGTPALLLALTMLDERRGGSGKSLNTSVDDIRQKLTSPGARAKFDGLLIQAGYLPGHREIYNDLRYTVRDLRFWHVRGSFPRLVESDLPGGVGNCTYDVNISGLDAYRIKLDEVTALIGGSSV